MNNNEYEPLQREYTRIAPHYDTRWKDYLAASIQETHRRLHPAPEDHILDIGCGTGALLDALSPSAPEAQRAGIDVSKAMLDVARQRLTCDISLMQARAESLPFGKAMFDLVVSISVFHLIRQPMAALQEMLRVLKPSGQMVITDWCRDYFTLSAYDIFLRMSDRAYVRTYTSKEMRMLLVEAGFADVNVEPYKINGFWGLMTATATKDGS